MKMHHSLLTISLFSLLSFATYADDVPQDDLGAQKLNGMECVSEAAQRCINDTCLNSDSVDCESNCKKLAQDKCQNQINE